MAEFRFPGSEALSVGSRMGSSTQRAQPDVVTSCLEGVDSAFKLVNKAVSGEPELPVKGPASCYKPPLPPEKMDMLSKKTFSDNTNCKINWAMNLYCDWYFKRCKAAECDSRIKWSNLESGQLVVANLAYSLSCFISEVRKKDGGEYPGDSLYQLVICIQFHLEHTGRHWKLIDGEDFLPLKFTLDNLMKERAALRLGKRKTSSPISVAQEDELWAKGMLGTSNPDQLRDTMLFLLGLHLALRGGKEHKDLCSPSFDSQLSVHTDSEGVKYLLFSEDLQRKTNQGSLTSRKKSQGCEMKVYGHSHPERNIINIFKKYTNLLPAGGKSPAFYKHSLPKFSLKPGQWYADRPVGINLLKKTVKTIAEKGGLTGYFTNHSLRSSCATRMYSAGVDKQLIMETMGHRSECVRQYKRTSEDLLRAVQETISAVSESKQVKTVVSASSGAAAESNGFSPNIVEFEENEWFDTHVLNAEGETVSYKVNTGGKPSHAHKNPCLSEKATGKCTDLCSVLKKVDTKTEANKANKRSLSLKFKNTC